MDVVQTVRRFHCHSNFLHGLYTSLVLLFLARQMASDHGEWRNDVLNKPKRKKKKARIACNEK